MIVIVNMFLLINYHLKISNDKQEKIIDSSASSLLVPIDKVKYFQVSSVRRFDKYYPIHKNWNCYTIAISTDKVFLNPYWLIKDNKIFLLSTQNVASDDYFLQDN